MKNNRWTVGVVICFLSAIQGSAGTPPPKVSPDHAKNIKAGVQLFKDKVRNIFMASCLQCHGGKRTRADFNLSNRNALMASGVIGKDAKSSLLYQLITHQREPHMPHREKKLSPDAIAAVGKWIDLGAPYDMPLVAAKEKPEPKTVITDADRDFWSFRKLLVAAPPEVKNADWIRTPIDRFILAKLKTKNLEPNPAAGKRKLIRRAYFDLIGLPPSADEIESFVKSDDPNAYGKLIDKLLDSPHYGERWARHWMDIARFAESHGYEQDYTRPHAYHYRDFLIKAFNADMPFNQFVRWQIAGDELAPTDPLALTATGFLGAGSFPTQLTEAEFESARYDELDDMVATTGTAFLGLTIGCARCHDHKYDPIPARDYYRMASSFTTAIRTEVNLTLQPNAKPVKAQITSEGVKPLKHHADGRGFPHFYKKTYFLKRGDVHQKDGEAPQGFLRVLMRNGKDESHWRETPPADWKKTSFRRAALASWMTDTQHGAGHLLARVIVNRLWHHHFGRGLVATPSDFGMQGERPTHPELLDWLAVDLIHNGWKLKRLHKMMTTSAVYMQSSAFDKDRATIDRDNLYFWRWRPRRLEAEPIRDAMLTVGGMLDERMYGPGSLDENMKRRSVYFFIKRSKLIPMMMLFDWPEHLVSIGRRSVTTTAPQALLFMNSNQARQYADGFAKRLAGQPVEKAIATAYLSALGREPSERETKAITGFVTRQTAAYQKAGRPNAAHLAMTDVCQAVMSMNEFIYVD